LSIDTERWGEKQKRAHHRAAEMRKITFGGGIQENQYLNIYPLLDLTEKNSHHGMSYTKMKA